MKTSISLLAALLFTASLFATVPEKMSYQAVVRNTKGALVVNQNVGMQISIYYFQSKLITKNVYVETQTAATNENGLLSIEIGTGTVVEGVFANIDWGARNYYIKTEIDPGGKTSYSIISDAQLLSVPYALYAKTTQSFTETDPTWKGAADTISAIGRKGNVGIGTTTPAALLHTHGTGTGEGNLLFTGTYKETNPGNPPASGTGTRMMWYPDKAAFRVGRIIDKRWDKDSIGLYSVAMGYENKASGAYSTAMGFKTTASNINSTAIGNLTTASGETSIAMGWKTTASGYYSTAMGSNTTASGPVSTAMGGGTIASGNNSTTMGLHTKAYSYCEIAIGGFNTEYTPKAENYWETSDRLFVVGNGTSVSKRSNALTILKNGDMTVGGNLRVEGNITSKGQKTVEVSVVVNTTISGSSTTSISFTFPEAFSATPAAWVGNVTSGGGFAEVVMSVAQVTSTGGKLFIFNPLSGSKSPSYTVKIIASGKE